MAVTDVLNITEVEASQSQKEVTINEAINALANAGNASVVVLVGDVTSLDMPSAGPDFVFDRHLVFDLTDDMTPPSAPYTLQLPATQRIFIIRNLSSEEATIEVDPDSDGPDGAVAVIAAGDTRLLYSDGVGVFEIGGGGGGGSFGFIALNPQTGASYIPVIGDEENVLIQMNSASPQDLLVPSDATAAFPIGTVINWMQIGVGLLSFDADTGATLDSRGGAVDSAGRWAQGTITKISTDGWVLAGDIT